MIYLELMHPSGRTTIKKIKTKKKGTKAIRIDYYGSAHHFNTEAGVVKIHRKKPKKRKGR